MIDALVAGGGPAGAISGLLLARAGARVVIVDRETFPRDKLCGDTINPGAVALLDSLGVLQDELRRAPALAGMRLSGPHVQIAARYPRGLVGRAIRRREFDAALLDAAVRAGARFEPGLVVRSPLIDTVAGQPLVRGLVLRSRASGQTLRLPASMTIAADGRRSVLARGLGLSRHPPAFRRWAFGTYARGVSGMGDLGEMHVRPGRYIGLAPLGDGFVNVCVVTSVRPRGRRPRDVIDEAIAKTPELRERFAQAEFVSGVSVLGPLAVDVRTAGLNGLLLAGDAAGFIDPMTGDGIHLAMRGAVLAASEVLRVLEVGNLAGAAEHLAGARRADLSGKLRFNRMLRRLVASRASIGAAEWSARLMPALLRRLVCLAGDA